MSVKINGSGSSHAGNLVSSGKIKDSSSWSPPSASEENAYIAKHSLAEYGKFYLGEDTSMAPTDKGRFKFPYSSDFESADISGLRAAAQRGAQAGYTDIANRADSLFDQAKAKLGKPESKKEEAGEEKGKKVAKACEIIEGKQGQKTYLLDLI